MIFSVRAANMHFRTTERYAYKLFRGKRQHDYVFGLAGKKKVACVAFEHIRLRSVVKFNAFHNGRFHPSRHSTLLSSPQG